MSPFLLTPTERLADWKHLRRSLATMELPEQLSSVARYWAQAPLLKIAYDPDNPQSWLSPWEMVHANEWCRNSVAIGMEFTLRLAGLSADRMSLELIIDRDIQDMLLILEVDQQWTLNYDWGSVLPYPKTDHRVMKRFRFAGRGYLSL